MFWRKIDDMRAVVSTLNARLDLLQGKLDTVEATVSEIAARLYSVPTAAAAATPVKPEEEKKYV